MCNADTVARILPRMRSLTKQEHLKLLNDFDVLLNLIYSAQLSSHDDRNHCLDDMSGHLRRMLKVVASLGDAEIEHLRRSA